MHCRLPTLLREALGSLAFFGVYQHVKNSLTAHYATRHTSHNNNSIPRSLAVDNNTSSPKLSVWESTLIILTAGGVAGFCYVLLSHPLDVLSVAMQIDIPTYVTVNKPLLTLPASFTSTLSNIPWLARYTHSLLQPRPVSLASYRYKHMVDCIQQIIHEQGSIGLIKGLGSALARSVPCFSASFLAYEATLARFPVPINGSGSGAASATSET